MIFDRFLFVYAKNSEFFPRFAPGGLPHNFSYKAKSQRISFGLHTTSNLSSTSTATHGASFRRIYVSMTVFADAKCVCARIFDPKIIYVTIINHRLSRAHTMQILWKLLLFALSMSQELCNRRSLGIFPGQLINNSGAAGRYASITIQGLTKQQCELNSDGEFREEPPILAERTRVDIIRI